MSIVANAVGNLVSPMTGADFNGMSQAAATQRAQAQIMEVLEGRRNEDVKRIDIENMDIEVFRTHEQVGWQIFSQSWGIEPHTRTPNLKALKNILISKYRIFEDDVEHETLQIS